MRACITYALPYCWGADFQRAGPEREPLTPEVLADVKRHYGERRARAREAATGHHLIANDKSAMGSERGGAAPRIRIPREGRGRGFRMLRAFNDLMVNKQSNETAADFVRGKIRSIVHDPAPAELLCHVAAVPAYRKIVDEVAENGYKGFALA